jgi:hypothetical protein
MHDHRLENGRAWKAYTFAAIFLLPAFTATMFADVLLRPRLEANWEHAGLHNSRAEWLFRLPDVFISEGRLIVAAVVISFLCLELFWKEWPKYRLGALALATFLLNAAALLSRGSLYRVLDGRPLEEECDRPGSS